MENQTIVKIHTMMAFVNGEEIEQKLKIANDTFSVTCNPTWNWEIYEYRVKED